MEIAAKMRKRRKSRVLDQRNARLEVHPAGEAVTWYRSRISFILRFLRLFAANPISVFRFIRRFRRSTEKENANGTV